MATVSDSSRESALSVCEKLGETLVRIKVAPTPGYTQDNEFNAVANEWSYGDSLLNALNADGR